MQIVPLDGGWHLLAVSYTPPSGLGTLWVDGVLLWNQTTALLGSGFTSPGTHTCMRARECASHLAFESNTLMHSTLLL